MKQAIEIDSLEPKAKDFILIWKKKKGYTDTKTLTIGECIELIIATTYNLHMEDSDGRFFNKALINNESSISWDGDELIDILGV